MALLSTTALGSEWTGWYNRDAPSGYQDNENIIYEAPPCGEATPLDARCQANMGGSWVPWSQTKQVLSTPCGITGLVCVNAQNNGACFDYRVQYLCPPALTPTDPLFTVRRTNPKADGFDNAWIDSESWCTGQLIYDITNNGNNPVNPNIQATWTVSLPDDISLANPYSWGYTTTAGVGQTLGFSMSHNGFYMSPAGTSGATAHSAFALTLRCLADQPIDWSTKCSCLGLEDVTINQDTTDEIAR
eukprot:gene25651-11314_t